MPMSGRMRGSSWSSAMRTRTVAFWRSAVGTMLITCAGHAPVGIRVEHALDRLPCAHAVDVGLVDVDLDFARVHVDERRDARARVPAAGRNRRDHLARLRVLRDHDAAERRADLEVRERLATQARPAPRRRRPPPARRRGARRSALASASDAVEHALRDELALDQRAVALQRAARVGEPHLDLAQAATRRFEAARGHAGAPPARSSDRAARAPGPPRPRRLPRTAPR